MAHDGGDTLAGEARASRDFSDAPWFRAPGLRIVMDLLNKEGGEARIVGGAVRNALMGLQPSDFDIATTLKPQEVIERAEAAGLKAIPTGVDHGTVTLVHKGQPFEVTTLRADIATDGRRADVVFGTDWAVDAARRDLTINALYLDWHGKVIDLVDGLPDVETKTVRFIGDAERRIQEDYLRILRFFRFFAWYGGGRPDADGLKAAARLKSGLSHLSAERVWSETKKLLSAPDPSRALLWMRQAGVLTAILPETEKWGIDAIPGLIHAEDAFGWAPDPMLRLMAIVPPDAERLAALAKRLKLSKAEAARLERFSGVSLPRHDIGDLAFARSLYAQDVSAVRDRLRLAIASARTRARTDKNALSETAGYSRLIDRVEAWQRPVFPVSGNDLIEAGTPPGPELGAKQKRLEDAWIASNFTLDRDQLLAKVTTGEA
jgi:poly(A) polymerase